jgi:hypothetical protein
MHYRFYLVTVQMKVLQNGKMFPTSGRVYFWGTSKKASNPDCLVPTLKHGGRSVVILAAIFCWSVYSEWLNYYQ